MKTKKAVLTAVLLLSVICSSLSTTSVSAKSASKVTKIITLTHEKSWVQHILSIHSSEMVRAQVKILEVKGKPTLSKDQLYLGTYEFMNYKNGKAYDGSKGSFFTSWTNPKLTKKSFQKGKILKINSAWKKGESPYISGKAGVSWDLPEGISKLKMKITYYTKSGKKNIKSIKTESESV